MSLIPSILELIFRRRQKEIDYFCSNPVEVQQRELLSLLEYGTDTEIGRIYNFKGINNIEQFQQQVPICDYDSFSHYIDRARLGEQKIIWPTPIR